MIQIPVSAAIARYHHLTDRMHEVPTERLPAIIEDRHRLLIAIATKAKIPPKKNWRIQTLAWMDDQVMEAVR